MTSRVLLAGSTCLAALCFAAMLSGCGSTATTHSIPPMVITGNWELTLTLSNPHTTAGVAVYLTSNGSSVSGIAFGPAATDLVCAPNGCCGSPIGLFQEALTGTVDDVGNLKLENAVGANPVFTLTGVVNGQTLSSGNFAIAGTCATGGTVTGVEYPPLDGTWSGMLTSEATGQSFAVSAALSQSSGPNSDGYLNLVGTVNVSGYSCVASGGAAPFSVTTSYVGSYFNASFVPSPGATFFLTGILSPDGKTLAVNYGFTQAGNGCNGDGGSGTLALE